MKLKLISLIAVIVLGVVVLFMTISKQTSVEQEYKSYLSSARANAEKLIPYNACGYYQKAFAIRCDDEGIYKEYIEQAKALGDSFYRPAIEDYVVKFPGSKEAYELLCQMYYDSKSYSLVIDKALEANQKGIATDTVRSLYLECAFMLRTVASGFTELQSYQGTCARVKIGELYGYVDLNGSFLLAPLYEEASTMSGSGAAVNDGEEWHIINTAGYKVARTSKPVEYMGVLVGGKIPVAVDGKFGYVGTDLKIPDELPYDYASNFRNGVAAVKKDDKWGIIDAEGKMVTKFEYDDVILDEFDTCSNGNVIFVKKDGAYRMIDPSGSSISNKEFTDARAFVSLEPAAVCIDGKWGFVDTTGKVVIEPQYEDARSFNVGLGGVCIDGKWGYVNTSAESRIECQFEDCRSFAASGIAAVKSEDTWKFVRLLSYCE